MPLMGSIPENIHPEYERQVAPEDKARLLGQQGAVLWLCGLSGSGKSTLGNALERRLHEQGRFVVMLDGDNLRSGLNSNLGFTDEDRDENIRRAAELAKLLSRNGVIVIVTLITPREKFRAQAREILCEDNLGEVYVKASFDACRQRDVKGLYAKQAAGGIKHFTGAGSNFEEPEQADLVIDTETCSVAEGVQRLYDFYQQLAGKQSA